MALSLVTAPAAEPLSATEAKLHLRVDHSTDDTLITRLITAARQHAETFTRRALITQTWDLKLDAFPGAGEAIWLPFPPVTSVTSISYVDTAGASQTWGASEYTTDLPAGEKPARARIVEAYGYTYPSTRDVINAVTVRFVCGYGAAGSNVPSAILAGMLLMIGHWWENREAVSLGAMTPVPHTVDALLWPYKAF